MPCIAVSSVDDAVHDLERLGFKAYLRKPVDHDVLVDSILAVMGGQ